MSALPEREGGILRMAFDLGWKTDWLTEMGPGLTSSLRECGRFVIVTSMSTGLADETRGNLDPKRWYARRRARIVFASLVVFDAWESRVLGEKEPNIHLVVDFLPGPWESHLANLWKAERAPS